MRRSGKHDASVASTLLDVPYATGGKERLNVAGAPACAGTQLEPRRELAAALKPPDVSLGKL